MRSILRHPEKYALYRELTAMVTATLYHGRGGMERADASFPVCPGANGTWRLPANVRSCRAR